MDHLLTLGISNPRARAVIKALKDGGVSSTKLLQVVSGSNLAPLLDSVDRELASQAEKEKLLGNEIEFNVRMPNNELVKMTGRCGESLCDIKGMQNLLERACGGTMACSTCHVLLDEKTFQSTPPASEAEEDMLDLAYGVNSTSRLSCQVILEDYMEGMVVEIPGQVNNMFEL